MRAVATVLVLFSLLASADEFQTAAPAFCNGQGSCPGSVSPLSLDAGLEQVGGNFSATHFNGNENAPRPTCLAPSGWWKTCTVVPGDDYSGTIVLTNGDSGAPTWGNNAALATIIPGRPFVDGGACIVQVGNIDAGSGFGNPPLIYGNWYDGGCNVMLILSVTSTASQINNGPAFNYMMRGL